MLFSTVYNEVDKIVLNAKLSVIKDLVTFLETKMEFDDDFTSFFTEFSDLLQNDETEEIKTNTKDVDKKSNKIIDIINTELVIIRGLPGAGKTTYAKKYFPTYVYLDADMYHTQPNGEYVFDMSKIVAAHSWCKDQMIKNLQEGNNVVVANTFINISQIQDYIKLIDKNNVKVSIIHVTSQFKSMHNVPLTTIQRFKNNWQIYPGEKLVKSD